jgi:glycosyltransferase involved in cell wall biosynthesis
MERLGLEGAVTFRPGVSDAELVEMYAEATAVAVPSLYEGFSLPAVEAMACEAPVVASAGGALPEVLGPDGLASLHVPPGDPAALAAALGRLLAGTATSGTGVSGTGASGTGASGTGPGAWGPGASGADLGARLGKAGRRRVLERFTWERCAVGVVEQYRSVIAEHADRGAGGSSQGQQEGQQPC